MQYTDCLNLITSAIEKKILKTKDGDVLVYRSAGKHNPEGWFNTRIKDFAKELMRNVKQQETLKEALTKK